MANAKIENYETTSDTFTFPYNPQSVDDNVPINNQTTTFPFKSIHYGIMGGGINPKQLVFNGHFSGTDKRSDFNKLANRLREKKLKKIYFASDRFYIAMGGSIKQTNSSQRQNFIDYVANFNSPVGILQGDTQKTATYDGSSWTNGSATNSGETRNFIEYVVITLDTGGSSGDTITINDNVGNGITITLDSYSENDTLTLSMMTTRDIGGGIVATRIFDADLGGTEQTTERAAGKDTKHLEIEKGDRVDNITFSGTAAVKTYEVKFRDGYLG